MCFILNVLILPKQTGSYLFVIFEIVFHLPNAIQSGAWGELSKCSEFIQLSKRTNLEKTFKRCQLNIPKI